MIMSVHVAVIFLRKNAVFPILLRYVALHVKALHGNGFHLYRLFIKGQDSIPPIAVKAAARLKVETPGRFL